MTFLYYLLLVPAWAASALRAAFARPAPAF